MEEHDAWRIRMRESAFRSVGQAKLPTDLVHAAKNSSLASDTDPLFALP